MMKKEKALCCRLYLKGKTLETVSYTRKDGKQITYKRRKPINEKVVCDLCGKSFKSYAARSTHFTYVHSEKG